MGNKNPSRVSLDTIANFIYRILYNVYLNISLKHLIEIGVCEFRFRATIQSRPFRPLSPHYSSRESVEYWYSGRSRRQVRRGVACFHAPVFTLATEIKEGRLSTITNRANTRVASIQSLFRAPAYLFAITTCTRVHMCTCVMPSLKRSKADMSNTRFAHEKTEAS